MSFQVLPLREVLDFFNGKVPVPAEDGQYTVFGSNGPIRMSMAFNHENAIILGRVGAYCGSVALCHDKFWASDNTIVVKAKDGFDLTYIYYRLFNAPLRSYAGGAAQPLLTHTILNALKLKLHTDRQVQRRIAETLSTYDSLIENNRRRIQLLEQAALLLYKEWFVHMRFPGHEHVRIKGGVPEGWERRALGEVSTLKYGKALREGDRIPGPFPVYGSSGVVGTHEKPLVQGPGMIVGRKGNVGSVYWSQEDFHPIDTVYFIDREQSNLYLYYTLLNTAFISTDVAVPGLNREFAHSRNLWIPEAKLKIFFEEIVAPIHKLIHAMSKYSEVLVKARDLLLPRLMNGEIAV